MNESTVWVRFAEPLVIIDGTAAAGKDPHARFTFQVGDHIFGGIDMSATMSAGTYATVSVEWKDKAGNTVKVDGPTKWESRDPETVQATVATGNPQIANLFAPGKVGTTQVMATADADLGEGVKSVTATIDIQVISGQAVGGEITFSQSPAQGGQSAGTAKKK